MSDTNYGYAGSILILNLTDESSEIIESEPYVKDWIGGHGLCSKLFWDYCEDKSVQAFDPKNVTVFAGNPFSGTLVPSSAARIEMTGLGPFSYPEWYTRSSVGGRIAGMMKAAGFDACVVCGKAQRHVWVSVVNDEVTYHEAESLWGKGTWETQETVWSKVTHGTPDGGWYEFTRSRDGGRSADRPAVLAIGPAGENLVRTATITHDASHVAGQSGLGAVWGSKNLKAISFLGSKSFEIADPASLIDLRIELQRGYGFHVDNPTIELASVAYAPMGEIIRQPGFSTLNWNLRDTTGRPEGCLGCYRNCRVTVKGRIGNEATCNAGLYYTASGKLEDQLKTNTMLNDLGIDGFEVDFIPYLRNLNKMGVMGPGLEIDTDLPFDQYNTMAFPETLLKRIAYREEIGDDLAEGLARAAMKWGRWDEDTATGLLDRPYWGYSMHYDPRVEAEWGYATILNERDVNEHALNWIIHWTPMLWTRLGGDWLSAEDFVKEITELMGLSDPACLDFSEAGMYSDKMVETTEWYRYHGRFWIQSMGMCDWAWPNLVNFVNFDQDNYGGASPRFELGFFKAVTGREITYEESLEYGRKFLMLDRAIWIEQGREREDEQFAKYIYEVPTQTPYYMPAIENGEWVYSQNLGRTLDRDKFEAVKTKLYEHDGLSDKGYPKRGELTKYGMDDVAKRLEELGKIG